MDSKERLKKAVDYLKNQDDTLTNEAIGAKLGYRSKSYVSDLVGGSKEINDIFLSKLQVEYSINKQWIVEGSGEMLLRGHKTPVGDPNEKRLELGDIKVTVADYIDLLQRYNQHLSAQVNSVVSSAKVETGLKEIIRTLREDHLELKQEIQSLKPVAHAKPSKA